MKKTALFPGSFDPFTKGHEDIVRRGLSLFDEIIIAIGHNSNKNRYFDVDLIIEKIKEVFANDERIKVIKYNALTAEIAREYDAKYLLRGIRNTTDFEYENSIAQVNSNINSALETVFLITSPQYAFISSSIIREVHKYNGEVSDYVPYKL